jgi:hypothetical protein
MAERHCVIPPEKLVCNIGGSYARELGIDLAGSDERERFKWFLAAILYGARISVPLATRTWKEFAKLEVLSPRVIIDTGWEGLVKILDAGGYARYDFKTATKLLAVSASLRDEYHGSLDRLHELAAGPRDLEARLRGLGKGIGPTTISIFLRELRGIWYKSASPLSSMASDAARTLGYLGPGRHTPSHALLQLQQLWGSRGQPKDRFVDFEAALVRKGLCLRHKKFHGGFSRRNAT